MTGRADRCRLVRCEPR